MANTFELYLNGKPLGFDSLLFSAIVLFKSQPFPTRVFGGVLERFGSLGRMGKLPLENQPFLGESHVEKLRDDPLMRSGVHSI